MTMKLRCRCGKAELVEPEPWNWDEAFEQAVVFIRHIAYGEHSPIEHDAALMQLGDLLEVWRARACLRYAMVRADQWGGTNPRKLVDEILDEAFSDPASTA
jgi:hypothetical protein